MKTMSAIAVLAVLFSGPAQAAPPAGGYTSCDQAAKDGASDIQQGSPGYRSSLDRDGDGVACESQ